MSAFGRWGLVGAVIAGLCSLFLFSPASGKPGDRLLSPIDPTSAAPLTIVFMGTSLSARVPWPDLVIARLAECGAAPLRARRIAEGGVTSAWALSRIEAVIAAAPELVLLEFAINDADLRHGLSLGTSRDNHRVLISRLKQGLPEARIILMTTNPATGLRRLLRPRLAAYYALYRELAVELDVGLIDLYPRWLAVRNLTQSFTDGLHPTEAAALSVVAPVVTSYLARLLGKDCAP